MPVNHPIPILAVIARLACAWSLAVGLAAAQTPAPPPSAPGPQPSTVQPPAQEDPVLTMAPHSEGGRYWVSGQANSIFQMHGHFHSPYEGANSLIDDFETKASEVATLYLG